MIPVCRRVRQLLHHTIQTSKFTQATNSASVFQAVRQAVTSGAEGSPVPGLPVTPGLIASIPGHRSTSAQDRCAHKKRGPRDEKDFFFKLK